MNLDDLGRWARGSGLEVVLLAIGSVLFVRFVRWSADRLSQRAQGEEDRENTKDLVAWEKRKHERALIQIVEWTAIALIYVVTSVMILERFDVPLTGLVAPAVVAGAALGFGAQNVVQDLLSGFFIFVERQYGDGDVIRIAQPGATDGISGMVEEQTLRTTKIRNDNGELVIIPNGQIRQVTNLSKDWARVVIDVPVAVDTDISKATDILNRIGKEMSTDKQWCSLLLESPSVMGIENFSAASLQLRYVARTLPGKQWEVARELRRRIAAAFSESNVAVQPATSASTGMGAGDVDVVVTPPATSAAKEHSPA